MTDSVTLTITLPQTGTTDDYIAAIVSGMYSNPEYRAKVALGSLLSHIRSANPVVHPPIWDKPLLSVAGGTVTMRRLSDADAKGIKDFGEAMQQMDIDKPYDIHAERLKADRQIEPEQPECNHEWRSVPTRAGLVRRCKLCGEE